MSTARSYRERAAGEPGTVLLEDARTHSSGAGRSFFFSEPVESLVAHRLDELPELFDRIEAGRARRLWAAGYLAYECGYHWQPKASPGYVVPEDGMPLAAFGLYREPAVFVSRHSSGDGSCELGHTRFDLSEEAFIEKVDRIHRMIESGDTYQVNLTGEVEGDFEGGVAALFGRMMDAQPVEFGALLRTGVHTVLSASPEMFFRLKDRRITARPMKGTATRGRDRAEDAQLAAALSQDAKNRAENVMIVDLLRSDLGRIAETGSVRVKNLFAVERYPSLLQMTSEVDAVLRPEIGSYELFASLFPCGSIVGAPKVRTMQILSELEGRRRGIYTGAIGYFAPDDEAVFSVAIRTAVVAEGRLTMGVGAGITYDSSPRAEYAECLLKAAFLQQRPFELIESMRWENGRCALLGLHLQRLAASAAYFDFACDLPSIERQLRAQGADLPEDQAWKLRLTLDRAGEVAFHAPEPIVDDAEPCKAMLWPEPVDSTDRFLRHKTTRRRLYDEASAAARQAGFADAIFRNERGEITEGAIHNIVVRHGDHWATPPLDSGVLPGVYRAHLLASMPDLREERLTTSALMDADEVWLTNAVRGLRLVGSVAYE